MSHDTWFCWECTVVRDLDCHGRCVSCGSDSLTPASLTQYKPGSPMPKDGRRAVTAGRSSFVHQSFPPRANRCPTSPRDWSLICSSKVAQAGLVR
jgi:hypothetical protein